MSGARDRLELLGLLMLIRKDGPDTGRFSLAASLRHAGRKPDSLLFLEPRAVQRFFLLRFTLPLSFSLESKSNLRLIGRSLVRQRLKQVRIEVEGGLDSRQVFQNELLTDRLIDAALSEVDNF